MRHLCGVALWVTNTLVSKPNKLIGLPRWTWLEWFFWSVIGALSGVDRHGLQFSRKSHKWMLRELDLSQGAKPHGLGSVLNVLQGGGRACGRVDVLITQHGGQSLSTQEGETLALNSEHLKTHEEVQKERSMCCKGPQARRRVSHCSPHENSD